MRFEWKSEIGCVPPHGMNSANRKKEIKNIPAGDAESIVAKDGIRVVAAVTGRGLDRYDCISGKWGG